MEQTKIQRYEWIRLWSSNDYLFDSIMLESSFSVLVSMRLTLIPKYIDIFNRFCDIFRQTVTRFTRTMSGNIMLLVFCCCFVFNLIGTDSFESAQFNELFAKKRRTNKTPNGWFLYWPSIRIYPLLKRRIATWPK